MLDDDGNYIHVYFPCKDLLIWVQENIALLVAYTILEASKFHVKWSYFVITVGSLSPVRGGPQDVVGDAMHAEAIRSALSDVASSSRKLDGRSGGWVSSEDEADAMEPDDEGFLVHSVTIFFNKYLNLAGSHSTQWAFLCDHFQILKQIGPA